MVNAPVTVGLEIHDLEMLELVHLMTEHVGRASGLDEDAAHWLSVAVRECVVNGLTHGNGGDPRKAVHVEFTTTPSSDSIELVVSVRDQGDGFDADALPDPCAPENLLRTSGRGIHLVRQFMDDVSFQRVAGGGMEVRMIRRISR